MAIMRSLVCLVVLAVAASASFVAMGPDGSIHLTRNSTVIGDLHAQGNIYVGDNPRLDVAALLTQILGGVASDAAYLKMTYVERGSTYLDPGSLDDRWNVRPWNRIEEDTGVPYEFIEADSTIWLDAGVYDFSVETVTHETGWHQVRIRDVQELRTLAAGSIGRSISSADTPSTVTGRLYLPKRTLIVVEEVFESEGQMGYGGPARYESGGRVSSLEIWNSASLSKEFLEGLVESDAETDPGVYTMEEFAIMSEMEAEGNTWTTFTTDIWVQRKLNAIRANYGGIISFHDPVTGYFQLRPGSYRVYGRASSPWGDRRTSRIYRVSPNPRTVVQGQSVYDLNGYVGHFSLIEGRLTTDGNDTFVMETHCDDVCYNVRMTNTGDSLPSLGCDLLIERIEPGVTSKEAMLQYRIQYGRNAGDITGYTWINNRQELNHVAYNDDQIVSLNADGSFALGPGTFEYHFAFQTYASDHNTARLWSETDKLVLGFGTSAYSRYADVSDAANAEGWGTLHLLKPHTIFFEGFSTRSIAGNGIGVECACEGADELYNFVKIRQVERISNQTAEVREFSYPLSNGPSMTGGLWQAREFNQVARGEQWISFPPARLHKQVLVQPGVYLADFFSATSTSDNSMTRIASMDEFNVMAVGSSQHVSPSYAKTGVSRGLGLLELAHPTELRVEHWSSTTNLFGRPSYSGNPEWHARLHLTRMHGLSDELAARVAELEDVDYYDDTDYDYILIEERQSPGIPAPPCPSVALENPVVRQISVMLEDGNGAATMSAATRTITLQPGVYDYRVRGSIRNCGEHKIVLQKTSGIPFTVGHGTSAYSASTTNSESTLVGRLVVDTASDFQIHHYTRSTPGTANAMGEAMPVLSGDGPEKYITAEFWVRSNHTAPKVHLRSSKGFATTAGASVANTWNQRDLEENFDDNGTLSMLDSFHFQLRAGVYDYRVEVPAFSTDDHRARLWDSTNERQVGLGSSSRCSTNNNGMSKLWGRLYVFNDTNQYSVQHWTESSEAFGMGYPAQIGSFDEYYASVELFRINPANVHTVILRELYEPGTHGPSYPDDRQSVRPFNHIVAYGETFAKLNDDSFTLAPGVYDIRIEVPARRADRFRARLFSKSDFSVVAWGTNTRAAIEELTAWSFIYARLYVPRTTNFQVESFAETASSTYVHRSDQGDMEIYTQGEIRRRPLASDDYIASLGALSAKPDTVGWIIRDTRPPRVAYTGLESTRGWNLRDMDPKAIQYLNEGSREYMEYNVATNEMIFLVAGSYDVEFEVTAHRTLGTRCRLACNGTTPYLYSTSGYAPNGASYADSRVFAWGRVHVQNNTACRFESGYQAIGAANHAGGTSSMDGAQASFLSAEFVRHEGSSDDVYIMRETRGYFTNGNPSSSSADVNLRWKTRAMDSKAVDDGSDVTINTDGSFTVQPGVYDIQALAVGYQCNGHQSRLYRVSPSPGPVQYPATPPIAASGLSAHARRNAYINTASYLLGRIEPMTATTYRVEQWTETYDAAGEGLMSRMGPEDEVYAMVKITKTSGNLIAFEKRSPGSFGGSVVANTWNPRSITHIIADTPFFTLLAGTFTLDPGLYKVYAAASAYASDYTRLRLYDRTHSAVLVLGETMFGHSGTSGSQHVSLRGAIEVREISELEIQHYCSRDSGSLTLGNPTSAPQSNEIFTILSIEPL